jgi:ParB family transcriptional regulator, chromosome partitioning protein
VPPKTSTLQFRHGRISPQDVVSLEARDEVRVEARRAMHAMKVSWLPLGLIDESREALNSRRAYETEGLNELAASIQEHGISQPILVTPVGDRYRVVCGERRRRAAVRAGLAEAPCIVKEQADDRTIFLWNVVENIQRVDLSPREKVDAIRRLAGSGLGVREISRGTGISPGTISKWIRIADKPAVVRALEDGRLDIFRAMQLASVKDSAEVDALIAAAPALSREEFERRAHSVSLGNTYCPDDGRLADVERKLALVRVVTPVGLVHLHRARRLIDQLRRQAATDAAAATDVVALPLMADSSRR